MLDMQIASETGTNMDIDRLLTKFAGLPMQPMNLREKLFAPKKFLTYFIYKERSGKHEKVNFVVRAPDDNSYSVKKALISQYGEDYVYLDTKQMEAIALYQYEQQLTLRSSVYGLQFTNELWTQLASDMPVDTMLCIQFKPVLKTESNQYKSSLEAEEARIHASNKSFDKQARSDNIKARLEQAETLFEVAISIRIKETRDTGKLYVLYKFIRDELRSTYNELYLDKHQEAVNPVLFTPRMILTKKELASFIIVPKAEVIETKKINTYHDLHVVTPSHKIDKEQFAHGVAVGFIEHPFYGRIIIRIPYGALETHMAIAGTTGTGKSTFILNMMAGMLEIDDLLLGQSTEEEVKYHA